MAEYRSQQLAKQGGRCKLCSLPCTEKEAVLDHDHDTGFVRGALHRGCNALLGKVENGYARFGVKNLAAFSNGLAGYISYHATNPSGVFHPTYRTDEEKRLKRNEQARKRRAVAKELANV